jgi:hypothetical protein
MFPDDDALDKQVQQRLLVFERCLSQPRTNAVAERSEARQHLLSADPLAA